MLEGVFPLKIHCYLPLPPLASMFNPCCRDNEQFDRTGIDGWIGDVGMESPPAIPIPPPLHSYE